MTEGKTVDSVMHVGYVFAGPGVKGSFTYATSSGASVSFGIAVNYDGAGFTALGGATTRVSMTDKYVTTNKRVALYKKVRVTEYSGNCTTDPALQNRPTSWLSASQILPGWTEGAVRTPPQGFPNCSTYKSEQNRFPYPERINFSRKRTDIVSQSIDVAAFGVSLSASLTNSSTLRLSYTSNKKGWVCTSGDSKIDDPSNWMIAGWNDPKK